jgi:competence protein ComEC
LTTIVQKIPFLRLVTALAAGIVAGNFFQTEPVGFAILTLFFTIVLFILNKNYSFRYNSFFGIGVHVVFAFIGIAVYSFYNQKPEFYNQGKYHAEILEILQEKPNSYQSVLKIKTFLKNDSVYKTAEKVMVYFEKTESAKKLKPGETILFIQTPQCVRNNNNPFEFDYQSYLSRKKIYRQVYLAEENWKKTEIRAGFSFFTLAERTRLKLMNIYREQNFGENEFHVLSALTLGYKRGLDPETKRIFSSAGAMHVLAVSGLHVGIIFLVINFLLGFLKKQRSGRIFYVFLVIPALWSFAFIAGLSPSVMRAATMFSFVVIGENIKRQSNIYNTLAASAFLLLLLNPNNLFEAGFQLSYSAVFGIVFLQPQLVKLFHFKYKVPQYFWELLTVSVAAQIATFPATAFYFNQFPAYFWLANLLVIPAVIILIPLAFSLLLFHWIPVLINIITFFAKLILNFVIQFLSFIEKLPFSVAEFALSVAELVLLIGIFLSVFLFIETQHKSYFKGALISVLLLLGTSLAIKTGNLFRKEMIVYNQSGQVLIHFIHGKRNYIVSVEELSETGYELNAVENTRRRLQLDVPVVLNSQQSFHDKFIFLKNGMVVFDGRIIFFKPAGSEVPENIVPEFVIDPPRNQIFNYTPGVKPIIISSNRFPVRQLAENSNIFYLREKGAFREKW